MSLPPPPPAIALVLQRIAEATAALPSPSSGVVDLLNINDDDDDSNGDNEILKRILASPYERIVSSMCATDTAEVVRIASEFSVLPVAPGVRD
jgi:hypothetical protein